MISTRHIRKDWPEWVDWQNQKTVSTMCGVRSQPHLSGIPGITKQPRIVERAGKRTWGWCRHCVKTTWPYYRPPALTADITSRAILNLHILAQQELVSQYRSILLDGLRRAQRDGRQPESVRIISQMIDQLDEEFASILTNTPAS